MTAFPPKPDVRLEWLKRAAYDPKQPVVGMANLGQDLPPNRVILRC